MDARRAHERYSVEARCIVRSARDGRLLADRALDISYSGARFASLADAALGERVDVSLEVPGTRTWIEASGRVQRVVAGKRRDDGEQALGVWLDRMNGMDRVVLASVARAHPALPATRGGARDYARVVERIAR